MKLVKIEGGSFLMGNDSGDTVDKPAHHATLKPFMLSAYQVSQSEWKALLGTNPSSIQGGTLPVDRISWLDAVAFCNALSAEAGLQPCYSNNGGAFVCDFSASGYRLPTEAEWEYAARAGAKSQGCLYPGSNNVDEVAWYLSNSKQVIHPAGKKKPNELGLYDMAGNVYEWCWDLFGPYCPDPADAVERVEDPRDEADRESTMEVLPLADALGPEKVPRRVMRGGNCLSPSYRLRCSSRWTGLPDRAYDLVGLRLARSLA